MVWAKYPDLSSTWTLLGYRRPGESGGGMHDSLAGYTWRPRLRHASYLGAGGCRGLPAEARKLEHDCPRQSKERAVAQIMLHPYSTLVLGKTVYDEMSSILPI